VKDYNGWDAKIVTPDKKVSPEEKPNTHDPQQKEKKSSKKKITGDDVYGD
jgi:hypothetical protein